MAGLTSLMGIIALAGFSFLGFVPEVAGQSCQTTTGRYQPQMSSGYRVSVLATGLAQPRHIAIDSAGNLLVAEGNSGSVQRLVLAENGENVCVTSKTALTSDRSVRFLRTLIPCCLQDRRDAWY